MQGSVRQIDVPQLSSDGLGQIDEGIAFFDADNRLTLWNSRFATLLDVPAPLLQAGAELAALMRHLARRGDFGPGEAENLARLAVLRAVSPGQRRFEHRRADGVMLEATESATSGGLALIYRDLSEKRLRERALRELAEQRAQALELSETRLKLIADEVPAGIAHIDQEMRFLYANKRFAAAYNFRPEDLIGLSTAEVLLPRTLAESARFFEQSRRGALVDFEMRIELPGARFKDIRTLLRPEQPSSGEVIGFYLLSIDVTRRKATMSALMGAHKMDALGRMASGISHDFNNLLTIILGNLVPLSEHLGDSNLVAEYLTPAISAARRGSGLTQRLLTIARREQYAPEPTNIDPAVADICTLLRSSIPRSLEIRHTSGTDIPDAMVDRAQLEMALLNLAVNARDATGGEGVFSVEVSRCQLQPGEAELLHVPFGPYVRIIVSDDGCGMTPEQTDRIFEPFYTSKAAGAGSGLGLSMVYGFAKQSNGAISVDSAPGEGATFTILLPSVDLTAPPQPPEAQPEPSTADEIARVTDHMPLILLVDDDRGVRRTIRRRIAEIGYPLIEADDADEALQLLSRINSIGVVLSDVNMPGSLDGHGLSQAISEKYPEIAVVLMSGRINPSGTGHTPFPGLPFLQKPFSDAQLSDALRAASVLHLRRTSGGERKV